MERNFKRISDGLKLPQESRERIRSQLASYQKQSEDIPMKKSTLKSRVPLIAVAVVMMMALTLTAAAAVVVHLFRNDIIVSRCCCYRRPRRKPARHFGRNDKI